MRRFAMLFVLACVPALAEAQVGSSGLISPEAARRVGLERMWFTQLGLDRSRGRVSGAYMHVSPTQSHTVFQIVQDGRRYLFSQRERNAFGEEIGVEGARKKAEERAEAIKKDLKAAGQTDAAEPTIETYVVPKITLYATSERGMVHALDGETGRTLWTTSIGSPLLPTSAPAANEKYVGVCNGSTIYVLLTESGSVVWSRHAVGAPGAGPALTDDHLFVPMVNGQLESYLLEDPKQPLSVYKCFGRTMVQPVISTNSVAWPTDTGNLYVSAAHGQGVRFRMKASAAVSSAPAFLAPNKIFVASIDGYLYCVSEDRGAIEWRFTMGEPIVHSPVALADQVFVISERGNMYAIDADSPTERWVAAGISAYLAGSEKRLYCRDTRGDLAILDAATGSRLGTVAAPQSDAPFLNTQTDRIFLVSSTGLVQCLRETNLPFPIVHYRIEPREKVAKVVPTKRGSKTEEKSEQKEADPFGDSPTRPSSPPAAAGADPFAAPAAPKPATPPPPGDNPFATP
jgi:outer membrane protein assembly factor BamB